MYPDRDLRQSHWISKQRPGDQVGVISIPGLFPSSGLYAHGPYQAEV